MSISHAASLDQQIEIETPEQVAFSYTIAGVGSRAAAALLDYAICLLLFFALLVVLAIPARQLGDASGAWIFAVFVLLQFVVLWGYYVLFEGLNDGQTPGKRQLGLRVVMDGGYSVTFSASAVRNLVRMLDLQPVFSYLIGLVAVALSKSGKRLGDHAAGTIVVHERVVSLAASSVPARALPHALLTDEEFGLLERYALRRQALDPDRRREFADRLAARFRDRMPHDTGGSQAFALRLFEHERAARAAGAASRSDRGAAREQHAIIAHGSGRWAEFASRLAIARQRGLARLPADEVSEFVALYRELATDLARLRTASRGREPEALFYLSRLVAAGHNLFYRQRRIPGRAAFGFLFREVPAEVRRSWRPVLLAAALLFGPGAITYASVVRHPASVAELVPPHMLDRAEEGRRRALTDDGYIPDPELFRPVMASRIVANNVQVTFAAFAFGMTAGVGTLLLLVMNGVSLGAVLGLYSTKGILSLILAFVAPHGVLELTAICIAGGAGFLLAAAILLPGARTRGDALVENGRRAIRLIAASTFMLLVAGALEGLVSPIPYWPLDLKLIVAAVTAVALFAYLRLGAPSPRPNRTDLTGSSNRHNT